MGWFGVASALGAVAFFIIGAVKMFRLEYSTDPQPIGEAFGFITLGLAAYVVYRVAAQAAEEDRVYPESPSPTERDVELQPDAEPWQPGPPVP